MNKDLFILEEKLHYSFKNKDLLNQAVTHSSYANEVYGDAMMDNERLEFLGDAVLDMVITRVLFGMDFGKAEGDLTKLRATIVCEKSLASISRRYGLNEFLRLGKGEEANGGRNRDSIIADGVEALIGAIYLDSDYYTVSKMLEEAFADVIKEAHIEGGRIDSKTELQEKLQASGPCLIEYKQLREFGPDHDKSFVFAVYANGEKLGEGTGKSKKEAQANAASDALKGL